MREADVLGTMPDPQAAALLGVGVDAARNRRAALGIPAYRQPARPCRVCDRPASCRAGFCHTHGERWRRWGKPDPAEWAAAFLGGRLNTCDECGRTWNGYHGATHCSGQCLAAHKRRAALERYHAKTPAQKRADESRKLERGRVERRASWVTGPCVICGREFTGPARRKTCGRPECRSKNTTRNSRAHRTRQATGDITRAAAELERRAREQA